MADIYVDFRGCSNLVYAPIIIDTKDTYETGDVKVLAGLGEISKTTATSTGVKNYDNAPRIIINAEGEDTVTLSVSALPLETLADIIGKEVDAETGALMDGEPKQTYFALGYILDKTDDTKRYVWRYKCTAAIPDESSKTKENNTDSTGQSIVITGIHTNHIFKKPGKTQKALVIDEADDKADLSTFFDTVTTIDTLKPKTVKSI